MRISKEIWNDYSLVIWASGLAVGILSVFIPAATYNTTAGWLILPYVIWGAAYCYTWALKRVKYASWAYEIAILGGCLPFLVIFLLLRKYRNESPLPSLKPATLSKITHTKMNTPKTYKNKIALALALCTLFVHVLFIMNKTYDGMSKEQFGSHNIYKRTYIAYFNFFPLWSVNVFYSIYFLYALLIVLGVVKFEIKNSN